MAAPRREAGDLADAIIWAGLILVTIYFVVRTLV